MAALQLALNHHGADLSAAGAFGRVTEIAVQQFQQARGLQADGAAGSITARELGL